MAVGALQQDGTTWPGSNIGLKSVDFMAPGARVLPSTLSPNHLSCTKHPSNYNSRLLRDGFCRVASVSSHLVELELVLRCDASSLASCSIQTFTESAHSEGAFTQVLGLAPGGSYITMTGTSMANPHVAGVAAIVLAK